MKIAVLIKCVPDTEASIKIKENHTLLDYSLVKFIINPYDEIALEEALKIKDKNTNVLVKIFSVCNSNLTKDVIIKALAMGADEALIIHDENILNFNYLLLAHVLNKELKEYNPDIIYCGKNSIDLNSGYLPIMLSHLLNIPYLGPISFFKLEDEKNAIVKKNADNNLIEEYKINLPCIISANRTLNQPRYASLAGILKAKKKPITIKNIKDYSSYVNQNADLLSINFEYPNIKKNLQIIEGNSPEEKANKLIKILHENLNII